MKKILLAGLAIALTMTAVQADPQHDADEAKSGAAYAESMAIAERNNGDASRAESGVAYADASDAYWNHIDYIRDTHGQTVVDMIDGIMSSGYTKWSFAYDWLDVGDNYLTIGGQYGTDGAYFYYDNPPDYVTATELFDDSKGAYQIARNAYDNSLTGAEEAETKFQDAHGWIIYYLTH